jgi:hypothetical protein
MERTLQIVCCHFLEIAAEVFQRKDAKVQRRNDFEKLDCPFWESPFGERKLPDALPRISLRPLLWLGYFAPWR